MRVAIIEEVCIERNPEYKNPFVCPICGFVVEEEDYLRFFLLNRKNPICVHESCLLKKIGVRSR